VFRRRTNMHVAAGRRITLVTAQARRFFVRMDILCQHQRQTLKMPTSHRIADEQLAHNDAGNGKGESPAASASLLGLGSAAQMAVFSADLQGEFLGCNPAFSQLLGYSPGELLPRDFAVLFGEREKANREDQAQLRKVMLAAISAEGGYHSRLFAHTKAGSGVPVQFS